MIELELTIMFVVALVFSVLYELAGHLSLAAFAWVGWWVFSLYWIYAGGSLNFMAYLPFGIGWIYLARLFLDLIDIRRASRRLGE